MNTTKEIAKAAGVSHDTIAKVEKIEQKATPEIKAALKAGDISINEGYKAIKRAEKIKSQFRVTTMRKLLHAISLRTYEKKFFTPPTM